MVAAALELVIWRFEIIEAIDSLCFSAAKPIYVESSEESDFY